MLQPSVGWGPQVCQRQICRRALACMLLSAFERVCSPWIAAQYGSCLPSLWLADMQLSPVSLPANVATLADANSSALLCSQQVTLLPVLF